MLGLLLAAAQVVSPLTPPAGVSSSTMNSAITAAVSGKADAAAIPPPCTTMPSSDTYGGRVGTATPCTPPADAARATQVQAVSVVTDANGQFTGNWPTSFASAPTTAYAAVYGQSQPFLCGILTKTATGFTGKCWVLTTTTLPSTALALLGLVLSPFQNAAASLPVTVIGRQ